ncbi:MAG: hypothetical protein IPI88_01800 [Chitinophagaceae bacterium]|nr:hypothetical protein [Chitinophagaceae bacterium]
MTAYFIQSKDLEALGYILYAKQVEPYVTGGEGDWNAPARDSLKMAKLIKNGQQLYAVAKKIFLNRSMLTSFYAWRITVKDILMLLTGTMSLLPEQPVTAFYNH